MRSLVTSTRVAAGGDGEKGAGEFGVHGFYIG
jgi:hypothetical protein